MSISCNFYRTVMNGETLCTVTTEIRFVLLSLPTIHLHFTDNNYYPGPRVSHLRLTIKYVSPYYFRYSLTVNTTELDFLRDRNQLSSQKSQFYQPVFWFQNENQPVFLFQNELNILFFLSFYNSWWGHFFFFYGTS